MAASFILGFLDPLLLSEAVVSNKPIRTKPEPYCPECGAKMKLRRPRPDQDWESFWGCSQFPHCRTTVQIGNDGLPKHPDLEDAWQLE